MHVLEWRAQVNHAAFVMHAAATRTFPLSGEDCSLGLFMMAAVGLVPDLKWQLTHVMGHWQPRRKT